MDIFGPNCAIKMPLSTDTIILQAEVITIAQTKGMEGVVINIISDNQEALKALKLYLWAGISLRMPHQLQATDERK